MPETEHANPQQAKPAQRQFQARLFRFFGRKAEAEQHGSGHGTGASSNKKNRSKKGRRRLRLTEKRLQIWLPIIFTGLIFLVSAVYSVVSIFQWQTMQGSLDLGRKQLDTANRAIAQAQLAQLDADVARLDATRAEKEAANRAERATKATESAADSMAKQANTSKTQAENTRRLADATNLGIVTANRAYISIDKMRFLNPLEPNKALILIFEFVNDGNSSAEISGAATQYFDSTLNRCEYGAPAFDRIAVAPKSPRTQRLIIFRNGFSQSDLDEVRGGSKYIQICIRGTYTTLNDSYPVENCSYYFPEMNTFLECKKQ